MATKKKDLEIVYNLQWKNRPIIGDEKSNMVGMYDIPATTLNWDTFKSYLLKNSGTTGDDVKVSYISIDDKEVTIESQLDFQVALYVFRQRARMGEIITLKLDRIVDKKSKSMLLSLKKPRQSADVQVQVDSKQSSSCCTHEPPEWFVTYMKKFKEEIVEEIAAISPSKPSNVCQSIGHHSRKSKVDGYKRNRKMPLLLADIANDKEVSKTSKLERKLENKLEKLEHKTLKIKAKKMALRVSSDSDVGRGNTKSRPIGLPPSDSEIFMNASAVTNFETTIPHMSGGETYLQQWKVINSGKLPWTTDTELRYAWGSQAFVPVDKRVPCPHLSPGEEGTVAVLLEIPTTPGHYECYWHFHHNGRRFGHWLGCQVIVDDPPVKDSLYLPPAKYDVINIQDMYELVLPTSWTSSPKPKVKPEQPKTEEPVEEAKAVEIQEGNDLNKFAPTLVPIKFEAAPSKVNDLSHLPSCLIPIEIDVDPRKVNKTEDSKPNEYENALDTINTSLQNLKLHTGCDSDNQSIISISDSNTSANSISSEEFVLVPISNADENMEQNILQKLSSRESLEKFNIGAVSPELNEVLQRSETSQGVAAEKKQESDTNNNTEEVSQASTTSTAKQDAPMDLSNKCNSVTSIKSESPDNDKSGYAYIYYNGQRIPIAKEYLRPDYLVTAEEALHPEECIVDLCKYDSKSVKNDESSVQNNPQSEYVSIDSTFNESHCSATGSSFSEKTGVQNNSSKRFFVFPQNYPGYEVINLPSVSYPWEDYHREILVNDWTTGQNYPSNYPLYYPNHNPFVRTGYNYETVKPQEDPTVNSNPFNVTPESKCPYKINEHTLAGCNPNTCKLGSEFEAANSTRSCSTQSASSRNKFGNPSAQSVPDNLLTGAAIVATSAMNTARSVLNMIVNPRNSNIGRWENGHWVSTNPESKREKSLRILNEMGFLDRDLNATLLARYNDDITKVIFELVQ